MLVDAFLRQVQKGQFAPVYLLAGSEVFFRDKVREAVIEFFLGGRAEDLVEHDLAEVAVRDALDDAATLGLFASRRVVWLRNAEAILPRRVARAAAAEENDTERATAGRHSLETISAYLKRPNPQTVVVFEARLDEKEKISRLEKILEGCQKVELERPPAPDAARHLSEEARRAGYSLDGQAALELVESAGSNLARARTELDKLMAYAGARRTITLEDVRALVPAEPTYIVWELGDAIGRRDAAGALERLAALLRVGHKPLPILGLIASHIRKLLRAKSGTSQWLPPEVRRQAQKIPMADLVKALERLFQADLELRSSPPDDQLVLERLVLDLAGKKGS